MSAPLHKGQVDSAREPWLTSESKDDEHSPNKESTEQKKENSMDAILKDRFAEPQLCNSPLKEHKDCKVIHVHALKSWLLLTQAVVRIEPRETKLWRQHSSITVYISALGTLDLL